MVSCNHRNDRVGTVWAVTSVFWRTSSSQLLSIYYDGASNPTCLDLTYLPNKSDWLKEEKLIFHRRGAGVAAFAKQRRLEMDPPDENKLGFRRRGSRGDVVEIAARRTRATTIRRRHRFNSGQSCISQQTETVNYTNGKQYIIDAQVKKRKVVTNSGPGKSGRDHGPTPIKFGQQAAPSVFGLVCVRELPDALLPYAVMVTSAAAVVRGLWQAGLPLLSALEMPRLTASLQRCFCCPGQELTHMRETLEEKLCEKRSPNRVSPSLCDGCRCMCENKPRARCESKS